MSSIAEVKTEAIDIPLDEEDGGDGIQDEEVQLEKTVPPPKVEAAENALTVAKVKNEADSDPPVIVNDTPVGSGPQIVQVQGGNTLVSQGGARKVLRKVTNPELLKQLSGISTAANTPTSTVMIDGKKVIIIRKTAGAGTSATGKKGNGGEWIHRTRGGKPLF